MGQGQCGSCWTFSATGGLEGMWKKYHGELISMSEQRLLDCGRGSCNGGLMNEARDGSCRFNSNQQVAHCSGTQRVTHSESAMEAALAQVGYPVSIALAATNGFSHYSGGVFSDHSCKNQQVNHAVLLVGYDKTGSKPYWIV